jgi:hypothetical protein
MNTLQSINSGQMKQYYFIDISRKILFLTGKNRKGRGVSKGRLSVLFYCSVTAEKLKP